MIAGAGLRSHVRSVRVAFIGKGGAGKSVTAGTFARLLAAGGRRVLAVDSDPLPGLAFAVGVASEDAGLPDEAIAEVPEGQQPRFRLADGLTVSEAVDRYAAEGADGLRFLSFGKSRGVRGEHMASRVVFRQILAELEREEWSIVGDLPGGTRQPFFGWARYADTVLVVLEPTGKSVLTARRLCRLGQVADGPRLLAVVTKVTDADDPEAVAAAAGLDLAAAIPHDLAVRDADRAGAALIDVAPAAPAVRAVASLIPQVDGGHAR